MFKKTSYAIAALAILNGCSLLGAMPPIEYNNVVVDALNKSTHAIQETADAYNTDVPTEVSETSTIQTANMTAMLKSAQEELKPLKELTLLESRNIEQQNAVRLDLETYQLAAEQYLKRYEEVVTFYQEKRFTQDVNKVEELNTLLSTDYTTFIEANNDLVQTLDNSISK